MLHRSPSVRRTSQNRTEQSACHTAAKHDLHESSTDYMTEVRGVYRDLSDKSGWRRIVCSMGGVMRSAEDIGHEVFSRAFL